MKNLSLIAAFLLSGSLLAGCSFLDGGDDFEEGEPGQPGPPQEQVVPSDSPDENNDEFSE